MRMISSTFGVSCTGDNHKNDKRYDVNPILGEERSVVLLVSSLPFSLFLFNTLNVCLSIRTNNKIISNCGRKYKNSHWSDDLVTDDDRRIE